MPVPDSLVNDPAIAGPLGSLALSCVRPYSSSLALRALRWSEGLERLGVVLPDARGPVQRLSGGQRQAVAIARALRWNAGVVVMDEPTAALGVRETEGVLALVRRLQAEGRTVLLVSHDMRDVAALATRVVVLRGGRKAEDRPAAGMTPEALFQLVMGAR